jgi:ADP-L-glycero-D-manno-heptose 6-epimerase
MFVELGKPEIIDFIPMPEALKGRYQYFTQAVMRKLPAARYARPMMTLESGVHHYVPDYLVRSDLYR